MSATISTSYRTPVGATLSTGSQPTATGVRPCTDDTLALSSHGENDFSASNRQLRSLAKNRPTTSDSPPPPQGHAAARPAVQATTAADFAAGGVDRGVPAAQPARGSVTQQFSNGASYGVFHTGQLSGATDPKWAKGFPADWAKSGALDAQGNLYVDRVSPAMVDELNPSQTKSLGGFLQGKRVDATMNFTDPRQGLSSQTSPVNLPAGDVLARNLQMMSGTEKHPGEALAKWYAVDPKSVLDPETLPGEPTDNKKATGLVMDNLSSTVNVMKGNNGGMLDSSSDENYTNSSSLANLIDQYMGSHPNVNQQTLAQSLTTKVSGALLAKQPGLSPDRQNQIQAGNVGAFTASVLGGLYKYNATSKVDFGTLAKYFLNGAVEGGAGVLGPGGSLLADGLGGIIGSFLPASTQSSNNQELIKHVRLTTEQYQAGSAYTAGNDTDYGNYDHTFAALFQNTFAGVTGQSIS